MNFSTNGWYYKSLNDRAPAWTGVNEFWNFGVNNDQSNDFVGGFTLIPCSQNELEAGDVIQLYNGVKYYHTLLVTGVDGRITVSAHDNDSFNVPLVDININLCVALALWIKWYNLPYKNTKTPRFALDFKL